MNNIDLSVIDNLALSLDTPQKWEVVNTLNLNDIIPDPDQPRNERNREEDKNLADSIQSDGVIQPIIVRPKSESGYYMIVCGERRYDASIIAGLKTIPAIIRDIDTSMILTIQTVENIQRDNMSLTDEIAAVAKIAKEHGTKRTAELLGKKSQYVSKRVRVFKADQYILDFIKTGYSNDFAAFYELALLDGKNHEEAKTLVDTWMDSPALRTSLRTQIDDVKSRLSEPKNKAVIDLSESNKQELPGKESNGLDSVNANSEVLDSDSHHGPVNDDEIEHDPRVSLTSQPKNTNDLNPELNNIVNVGGAPKAFKIESLKYAKLLSFIFDDGGHVNIEISHNKWVDFIHEVNNQKV